MAHIEASKPPITGLLAASASTFIVFNWANRILSMWDVKIIEQASVLGNHADVRVVTTNHDQTRLPTPSALVSHRQ